MLADSYLLPLAETIALSLGLKMMRQGDAVKQAKQEDESVDHAMTTNAELMKKMELSRAQKILLRFNVGMKNSSFCYKMTFRANGHRRVALDSEMCIEDAWDLVHMDELEDCFLWIQKQWDSMCEDMYWDNTSDSHLVYDFDEGIYVLYISNDIG